MTQNSKVHTVLVLDLDDTLYQEADYVLSGIRYVADLLQRLTGKEIEKQLLSFHRVNPTGDFLDIALGELCLPISAKESLLWSYRLHQPDIELAPQVRQWLEKCVREYHAVAILTDGRSITQRLKLEALGLIDIPVYISEEWGSVKPDPERFLAIQERWTAEHFVYVGDNPAKDFITPNQLGWKSVGLKDKGRNIYPQDYLDNSVFAPIQWVDQLWDVGN